MIYYSPEGGADPEGCRRGFGGGAALQPPNRRHPSHGEHPYPFPAFSFFGKGSKLNHSFFFLHCREFFF